MSSRVDRLVSVFLALLLAALSAVARAQTFKVSSDPSTSEQEAHGSQSATPAKPLGWGSNIQNARLARAAELALKDGKYEAALGYAQRASQAAPNDPQLWFLLGYSARLAGHLQLSIDAYNQGLRLNPSSLDGMSGLAQAYARAGRVEETRRLLTRVLSVDPKRTGDQIILGESLLQSGQYSEALAGLKRAEQVQPSARTELLIALACRHLNDPKEANRYLQLARQRSPNDPDVRRSLAGYYRDAGDYAAAIATLKPVVGTNPRLKAELAYTYQLSGNLEEAARLYAQAADAAPKELDLQLSASLAEVSVSALPEAKGFLARGASIDPHYYRVHAIGGQIARLEDKISDAVREYNAALEALPAAPAEGPQYGIQLHMDLMELYRSMGDDPASRKQLEIARSLIEGMDQPGPQRGDFLRLRALIKMNAGDTEGARQDLQEALTIDSKNPHTLQLEGDVLAKLGRLEDAIAVYRKILTMDPANRFALTALGYVSRDAGRDRDAEKYFQRLAAAHPTLYVPYLALGDMYTSRRDFSNAESSYAKAYHLAPNQPLIIAGGMNAAIEAQRYSLAHDWLQRASSEMQQDPQVMREKERYLRWTGNYEESAEVGREAIKKLPRDRDVIVYLGYDLLHLQRYDELLELTSRYQEALPKEPAIPLLAGYVHKHAGLLEDARADFTHSLERDSTVVTAYVNRGYVFKELHQPAPAAADFEAALRLEPKNGEAHLGLAYSSLDLHRPRVALRHVELAEQALGDSMPVHLIRATAYGEQGQLARAAKEYRAALKFSPDDAGLHLALADTLYSLHHYQETIDELQTAEKLSPGNSITYARLARSYAHLGDREKTLQNVRLAEQTGDSKVLVSTAEALSILGETDPAMQRLERALVAPDANRMEVRLAIARMMFQSGRFEDARRQIALGLMEVRERETVAPGTDQWMKAADLFLSMRDFELAQTFFERALAAGAPEGPVRVGLANTYLARGDTPRAEGQISLIKSSDDAEQSYDYLLARANILYQQHHDSQALTAFAQAANAAGEDDTAQREMLRVGGDEGLRINRKLSFLSTFSVTPIFEDTTVYPLDAKLDVAGTSASGNPSLLPSPRSSLETQWTGAYHLHLNGLPDASGFFQVRNDRGQISLPSVNQIVNRDTTDYSFNFGLNPVLHLGNNVLTFNTGLQETVRRDSRDPVDMNQNLFRQFVYMSTSSFFNMVAVNGYAIRETGPFTLSHLRSRDLSAQLNFRIGRPWGKTALLTGYGARDLQFSPAIREFFLTSSYVGIERKISDSFTLRAIAEDLRAWRVQGRDYATAQAFRPTTTIEYAPTRNWSVQGSVAYSRNMGFHVYDAVQSGFAVSYAMPVTRQFDDGGDHVRVRYPIRFTVGVQQQSFFNFAGGNKQQFRPYFSINVF